MKKWWQFAALCVLLALIAFLCVGCRSEATASDRLHMEARQAHYRAVHQCLSRYRANMWPNQVIFSQGEHPCIRCPKGHVPSCKELREMGL